MVGQYQEEEQEVTESDLLDLVHDFGEDLLEEAQKLCPEKTGWLKESGKYVPNNSGFEIIFDAPHARLIHDGKAPDEVVYIQKVSRHQRRKRRATSPLALNIDTRVTGVGTGNPEKQVSKRKSWSDLRALLNLKRKSNTIPVKAHQRRYVGKRPMYNPESGEWKVVNQTPQTPRPFIDDAYKNVLKQKRYREWKGIFPKALGKGRKEFLSRFINM